MHSVVRVARSRFTLIIIIRVVFDHTIYSAFFFSHFLIQMSDRKNAYEQKRQNICHSNIRFNFVFSIVRLCRRSEHSTFAERLSI